MGRALDRGRQIDGSDPGLQKYEKRSEVEIVGSFLTVMQANSSFGVIQLLKCAKLKSQHIE